MEGNAPWTGTPALPAELLHHVFTWLTPEEARSARLVCRAFNMVGKEHMLRVVHLVYKRDRLQKLVELAKDRAIVQHVKTFYWHAVRFKEKMTYSEWNKERESPLYLANFPTRSWSRDPSPGREQHTERALQSAYQAYSQLCDDQDHIQAERFDKQCLTTFFEACSVNLEKAILSLNPALRGHRSREVVSAAFRECMVEPVDDESVIDHGVQQFSSLIEALHSANAKPKHLSLIDLSHRILERHRHRKEMLTIMPNIQDFRLFLTWYDDGLDQVEYSFQGQETEEYYNNDELLTWLSAASQLRVLNIHLSEAAFYEFLLRGNIKQMIPSITFPKLREVGLTVFEATEDDLADLLLRHKNTLRRLTLSQAHLTKGTWDSFFARIGGNLPKLRKVKLYQQFLEEGRSLYAYDFTFVKRDNRVKLVKNALETFILYGGEFPDVEALAEALWNDTTADYTPPGRHHEADAGYTTDGSVVNYDSESEAEG